MAGANLRGLLVDRLDGIAEQLKQLRFRKITEADNDRLYDLLKRKLKGSPEWWKLNAHWRKKYKYSLRVQLIFDFIGKLVVPSGVGQGDLFELARFEKLFIVAVYDPTNPNMTRVVRRAILSIARKNGKTALIACLVLVHLVGPERVPNGEIYSAATEREQAAIVFKYAEQIINAEAELIALVKVVPTTKTMVAFDTGSVYRALSSEASSKFGYNPTVCIYDELAQAKTRDLYDALDTSMGAREEPLFIVISTQSNDPQHILSQLIDDGVKGEDPTTICHLYEIPEDLDIYDEKNWKLANPALGEFCTMDGLRSAAARAKRMPSFEAAFRNLHCNQRIDSNSPLITRSDWMACKAEGEQLTPGEEIYLGLDLSGKTDLTALVAVSAEGGDRVRAWFWKPDDTLEEHENRDRVPYRVWRDRGIIETTPGRAIQYAWVADRMGKIAAEYTIKGVAFDRYRIDDLLAALGDLGIDAYIDGKDNAMAGGIRMIPWGQGFRDMAPAVEAMEVSVLETSLKHDGNPCLTWNISNAYAVSDPAGNRKIDKSKTRFRIDGAVSLAMALGLKSRDLAAEPEISAYEGLSREEIFIQMAF